MICTARSPFSPGTYRTVTLALTRNRPSILVAESSEKVLVTESFPRPRRVTVTLAALEVVTVPEKYCPD